MIGCEVVNEKGGALIFRSAQVFGSGVHWISLRHFAQFKGVRVAAVEDGVDPSSALASGLRVSRADRALIRLSLPCGALQLISPPATPSNNPGGQGRRVALRARSARLIVSVSDVGNCLSVDPCFARGGVAPLFACIRASAAEARLRVLCRWSFVENFSLEPYGGSLEGFLDGGLKAPDAAPLKLARAVLDEELRVIAFERGESKHKVLEAKNGLRCVEKKRLAKALAGKSDETAFSKFFAKHERILLAPKAKGPETEQKESPKTEEISSISQILTRLAAKSLPRLTPLPPAGKIESVYLPHADALLVLNGVNKAAVVFERDPNGRFVVSPYVFETRDVHFYLTVEEWEGLLGQLDWAAVSRDLVFVDRVESALKALSDSAVRSEHHVFFRCPPPMLVALAEACLAALDPTPGETETEEVVKEVESGRETPEDSDPSNLGLADFFDGRAEPPRVEVVAPRPVDPKRADTLIEATQVARRALLKIEQALHSQSADYRSRRPEPRPHSPLARLRTFAACGGGVDIEAAVDAGLFFDSASSSLRAFFDPEGLPASTRCGEAFMAPAALRDRIELRWALSQARATVFWHQLVSASLSADNRLLTFLDGQGSVSIFAFRYGLVRIGGVDLRAFSAGGGSEFEGLIEAAAADPSTQYFAVLEATRFKSIHPVKTPVPKKQGDSKESKDGKDPKETKEAKEGKDGKDSKDQKESAELNGDKAIDKDLLDKLFSMGFPLDVCTKALADSPGLSVDAAVNAVLAYTAEHKPEKSGDKTSGLVPRAQWACPTCTFVNDSTSAGEDPTICSMCGMQADADIVFESQDEAEPMTTISSGEVNPSSSPTIIKDASTPQPPATTTTGENTSTPQPPTTDETENPSIPTDPKATTTIDGSPSGPQGLLPSDRVTCLRLISIDTLDHLDFWLLLVFYTSIDGKTHLRTYRLGYTPSTIRSTLIIDGKGLCQTSTWIGKLPLHRGREQKELGLLFKGEAFDQVHSLLPLSDSSAAVIHAFSAWEVEVQPSFSIEQLFVCPKTSESVEDSRMILFGESGILGMNLKQIPSGFDAAFDNLKPIDSGSSFVQTKESSFVVGKEKIQRISNEDLSLTVFFEAKGVVEAQAAGEDLLRIVTQDGKVHVKKIDEAQLAEGEEKEIDGKSSDESKTVDAKGCSATFSDESALSSPRSLLSALKQSHPQPFSIISTSNLVSFNLPLGSHLSNTVNSSLQSTIHLRTNPPTSQPNTVATLRLRVVASLPRSGEFSREFLGRAPATAALAASVSGGTSGGVGGGVMMPLVAAGPRAPQFSKAMHPSNALFNDGECFPINDLSAVYLFENAMEREMNVRRINFTVTESFLRNGPVERVLFFVFSDPAALGTLRRNGGLSLAHWTRLVSDNRLPDFARPVYSLDLSKAGSNVMTCELEGGRVGRFVAFLLVKKNEAAESAFFSIDFLGVEGDYADHEEGGNSREVELSGAPAIKEKVFITSSDKAEATDKEALLLASKGPSEEVENAATPELRALSVTETDSDLLVEFFAQQTLSLGKDGSLHIRLASSPDFRVHSVSPRLLRCPGGSIRLLKEQIERGQLTQLCKILSNFQKTLFPPNDAPALISDIEDFLRLVLHLSESIGQGFDEAFAEGFVWSAFIRRVAFELPRGGHPRLIAAFFDRFAALPIVREAARAGVEELLAAPPATNTRGQRLFWALVAKLLAQEGPSAPLAAAVAEFHARVLSKVHSLYSPQLKVLAILQVPAVVNGLCFENVDQPGRTRNVATPPAVAGRRIGFSGFEVLEPNSLDFFFLLEGQAELSLISVFVEDLKFNEPFTMDIYSLVGGKDFQLVRSKDFDQSLGNQILKSDKSETDHFGIGFWNQPLSASLLRIVIKFNNIASFHYSYTTSRPKFNFSLFSEKPNPSTPQPKSEAYFKSLEAELKANPKLKVQSIESSKVAPKPEDTPVEDKSEGPRLPFDSALERLQESKQMVDDIISRLSLAELTNRDLALVKLEGAINEYKKDSAQVAELVDSIPAELLRREENISFWLTINEEFLSNITETLNEEETRQFYSSCDKVQLAFYMLYDLYIFDEGQMNKSEVFRNKILASLDKNETSELLKRMIDAFLKEPEIIFLTHYQTFVNRLSSTSLKITSWETFLDEMKQLPSNSSEDDRNWRAFLLNSQMMGKKLESAKTNDVDKSYILQMVTYVNFLLENDLISASSKFKNILIKITKMIVYCFFGDEPTCDHIHSLKNIILQLSNANLLSLIDSPLEEHEKSALNTISSGKKISPQLQKTIETFNAQLIEIASVELKKETSEDSSRLLFFCLAHIKKYVDINKETKTQNASSAPSIPFDFISLLLKYITTKKLKNENIIQQVVHIIVNENISPESFKQFLDILLNLQESARQSLIESLTQSTSEIFVDSKPDQLKIDIATLMVEFVTKLISTEEGCKLLRSNPPLIDLCNQFNQLIIFPSNSSVIPPNVEVCHILLKSQTFVPLFHASATILNSDFNFGGLENFFNFPRKRISFLELLGNNFTIIAKAQQESKTPLYDVVKNSQKTPDPLLLNALNSLIPWLMCNFNLGSTEIKTPTGIILKRLFQDSLSLFKNLFKDEELSKHIVNFSCSSFKSIYQILLAKKEAKTQGYMSLLLIENALEFFELILAEVSCQPKLAQHFLKVNSGLDLIFETLNSVSAQKKKVAHDSSFLSKIKALSSPEKESEEGNKSAKVVSTRTKGELDIEFCNNLKMTSKEKNMTTTSHKEWHTNAHGKNGNIYTTSYTANKRSLKLRFKLANKTEIRNIKLGLIISRSENYFIVGSPSYVKLHGYYDDDKGQSQKIYIGDLERVEDCGYTHFLTEVYAFNLNKLTGPDFLKSIEELNENHEFTDFELTIGKPIITVVDKLSPQINKCTSPVNLVISFISGEGFLHSKVDIPASFSKKVEATFYNFVELLFNSDSSCDIIDSYIDSLPQDQAEKLFRMIENQLDAMMNSFNVKMSKFLMIMSQKNKKMSLSIFKFLKKNLEKNDFFYVLVEKIFERTKSHSFFLDFFEFGSLRLNESRTFGNKFLEVMCKYMIDLSISLSNSSHKSFPVPINKQFFTILLRKYCENPFNLNYEKTIVLIIQFFADGKIFNEFDPKPYLTEELIPGQVGSAQDTALIARNFLEMLFERISFKEYNFIHLVVYLATVFPAANEAIPRLGLIDIVIQLIRDEDRFKMEAHVALQTLITFPAYYDQLLELKFDEELFKGLEKGIESNSLEKDESYTKTYLKSVYAIFSKDLSRIELLEEKLFNMTKQFQQNKFFVEKILLSFFEFNELKFVNMVHSKTKIEKQVVKEEVSSVEGTRSVLFSSASINLNSEKLEILNEVARKILNEKMVSQLQKGTWKKEVETSFEYEDFSDVIESKMFTKSPLLFVFNCEYNGQNIEFIVMCPTGFVKSSSSTSKGYIPRSENAFISLIDSKNHFEYVFPEESEKFLEYDGQDPNMKSIFFVHEQQKKIKLMMNEEMPSTIDLYPLKPINTLPVDYDFPYDLQICNVEVYVFSGIEDESEQDQSGNYFYDQLLQPTSTNNLINVAKSIFSKKNIFELPNQLTIRSLENALKVIINCPDKQKLLKDFPEEIVNLSTSKPISVIENKDIEGQYNPKNPIFEVFIQRGGMKYLITKIIDSNSIEMFKSQEVMMSWKSLMVSILKLESLEGFLALMIQNKEFFTIIFELLISDAKSTRDWVLAEFNISCLIIQKLANILANSNSLELRLKLLKFDVLQLMLDRIASLTGEIRRRFDDSEEVEEDAKPKGPTPDENENLTKKIQKRKGVGYEKEGTGKKWNVNDYLTKKKQRNDFLIEILKLFQLLFNYDYPESEEIRSIKATCHRQICESCFLPLLESAFKSSSLHEMAKDSDLYDIYCDVLLTFSRRKEFYDLLLPIPKVFKPQQLQSLLEVLMVQEENANLFKKFTSNEEGKDEKSDSIDLANKILKTISQVKELYSDYFASLEKKEEHLSEEAISKINELPVNDQYKLAMKDMRFGLINMSKNNELVHHYSSNANSEAKSSSVARSIRLAQEIADLTSSLPIDSYNAIFVRSDETRLDLVKVLIAGAETTPYANGLFEYHIYLPAEYPACPPKCNLETTGSGAIRFNPNLYTCGKVCLSLLGTWRGSATENWDPKFSNLLQLLLSIQSVVMSEEVYFNEPGYEHEAGTEEGEARNEGYSNIVRVGNINFAMVNMIKKPPSGFEDVVRRHFYIKRDVILKECATWVKMAEVRNAMYSSLVSDHNSRYASLFNEPNGYINELKNQIKSLEAVLKELVANTEISTIFGSRKQLKAEKTAKSKKVAPGQNNNEKLAEKIDVTYDPEAKVEEFNADDAKVTDRWSRYIGVLGIDAVKKQSKASVLLVGVSAEGIEVAKNLVLSGLRRLELADWKQITRSELSSNFYAGEEDLGKTRTAAVLGKLRQLNSYVKVDERQISETSDCKFVEEFDAIVFCDFFAPVTKRVLLEAEKLKKKIVIADSIGPFSRIFCDFGDEFEVIDRDGEEPAECFIKSIDYEHNRIVLLEKSKHLMRVGDIIQLIEVSAKEDPALKPLNNAVFRVKDFNKITEIDIVEDLKEFQVYEGNGKIVERKSPQTFSFKRYSEIKEELIDPNLAFYDFAKLDDPALIARCYRIKEQFEEERNAPFWKITRKEFEALLAKHLPPAQAPSEPQTDSESAKQPKTEEQKTEEFVADEPKPEEQSQPQEPKEETKEPTDQKGEEKPSEPKVEALEVKLRLTLLGSFARIHSISAFVGGFAAQEVIKGITNKYVPIQQSFYCDFTELIEDRLLGLTGDEFWAFFENLSKNVDSSKHFYLLAMLGPQVFEAARSAKLFMVGAGAIGCELLKNLTMMGLGSGSGSITITDPDSIELSNLSRQFLFREKHISKPKALVAARVVESMSPEYCGGKIIAKLDKVWEESEDIFTDEFFQAQTLCLNALDNIRARVYMDQRCVRNSTPLLESGTLGPKCHVQVIVPFMTENYGQVQDAKEDGSIPICTLKMFPEEALHCMEWGKDKFDEFFTQNPRTLVRAADELTKSGSLDSLDFKVAKTALKFLISRPKNIADCVAKARKLFQKHFLNNIKQLLHVYPPDFRGKDGKLFWSLPKRLPAPQEFSISDPLHLALITSTTKLMVHMWGLDASGLETFDWAKALVDVKVKPFVPKEGAADSIKQEVEKGEEKPEEKDTEALEKTETNAEALKQKIEKEKQTLVTLAKELKEPGVAECLSKLTDLIFEKDDDKNGHVDFIANMTNLRARNYCLPEMDWISVKLKAGRIVPALATTTAAVAGLQTVEAIKVIKKLPIEKYRNAFVNLAIPVATMPEPGPQVFTALTPSLKVSVWDQWVYTFSAKEGNSLESFFSWVTSTYDLVPKDLMKGPKPIFLAVLGQWEESRSKPLDELLDIEEGENVFVQVVCTLKDSTAPVENVPPVKIVFKKDK